MYCMKCGREMENEQVFCDDCLQDMEKYPVPPGTTVQLPRRRENQPTKNSFFRRKAPPPLEDQVRQLRLTARILAVLLVVVSLLAALLAYPVIRDFVGTRYQTGQNYSASRAETTAY